MEKVEKLMPLLYILIVLSLILIANFVIPPVQEFTRERGLFEYILFGIGGAITLLGLTIAYLAKRWKVESRMKTYLIMTGFAAAFFLIGTVLHNMFYALAKTFEDLAVIKLLAQMLGVVSFILVLFGSPILFAIGAIGSILEGRKLKKKLICV